MTTAERLTAVMDELAGMASEENRAGMARYGIKTDDAFGVSVYELRRIARAYRRDHELALALWGTGNHEARVLASMVDDPAQVTQEQMESWAGDFDSWDVCDQVTSNLFDKTPFAYDKVAEWSGREGEWVKRAAFATAAALAVQDKKAADERFVPILALIRREAGDDRNFVKKAVNWALRNVGKRNAALNAEAVACAERILAAAGDGREPEARSARWIARDALRELNSDKRRAGLGLPPLTPAPDGDVTP